VFRYSLDEAKRARAEKLDGSYLLKTDRTDLSADEAWRIYRATASLCALEFVAHSAMLPTDMIVVQARVPKSLSMQTVEESDLPPNWSSPIPSKKTQDLGTDWVRSGATAVLSVPSVIIPSERNYLLNPAHPDFARIRFFPPRSFRFDRRLRPAR
jgi:RES domain-containing protein